MLRAGLLCRQGKTKACASSLVSTLLPKYVNFLGINVHDSVTRQSNRFLATKARSSTHFYDVLGLTPKATQKQIKTAYYELSKQFHPDINPSADSHKKFTQISEAYETLGNLNKKRAYDRGLYNPMFDHDPAEDLTEEHIRQRSSAFRAKRPPPTGKTSHYDFDEFYRQHYAEQIWAEQMRRQLEENRRVFAKNMQKQKKFIRNMLTSLVVLWVVTSLVASYSDLDDERRR